MKEQLLAELKELTENVSDTYDDFEYGINCTMKKQTPVLLSEIYI